MVKAGLEPKHWLSIFKAQLGVRTLQALQHLGSESYTDLKQFAQNPWEKRALRKLLGLEDEEMAMKSLRKNQKRMLQQREERAQQLLKDLMNLQKQGKTYQDKKVRQLMDSVQEALQVPEGSWIVKDSSLEALLTSLIRNIHQLGSELKASRDLSDVELLQHASGGRALQGVLVSRNPGDQWEIRENLLSVPSDAQLNAPLLCQDVVIEQFSSKLQEDQFTRSMDRLGYSATACAKVGTGAQMNASYSKRERMYYSTIKYLFVPMASFHFKASQLQLSADALRDLQGIEAFSGTQMTLQQHCEHFFRKYGSHAYKGQLHFGGIYWLKFFSYDFHESDLAEVKRLQSQAISASASYSCGFDATVKIKGDFSEALMSKTSVGVTKKGGPQTTSNIPLWKSGLVASNSTWSVIDCGSNTVPVWEIVEVCLYIGTETITLLKMCL